MPNDFKIVRKPRRQIEREKTLRAGLAVKWVTIREYLLLYVFDYSFFFVSEYHFYMFLIPCLTTYDINLDAFLRVWRAGKPVVRKWHQLNDAATPYLDAATL